MKATKQSAGIVILRQFEDGPRYLAGGLIGILYYTNKH